MASSGARSKSQKSVRTGLSTVVTGDGTEDGGQHPHDEPLSYEKFRDTISDLPGRPPLKGDELMSVFSILDMDRSGVLHRKELDGFPLIIGLERFQHMWRFKRMLVERWGGLSEAFRGIELWVGTEPKNAKGEWISGMNARPARGELTLREWLVFWREGMPVFKTVENLLLRVRKMFSSQDFM